MLLASALLACLYQVALAPWMGEDEPWHVEYAHHLARGYRPWGGLPISAPPRAAVDDRTLLPYSQLQVRRRFQGLPDSENARTEREILASMAEEHYYARVDWAGVEPQRDNFDAVAPDFSAMSQPPLYYAVGAALLAGARPQSAVGELYALRFLSALLFLGTVWAALGLARCAFDDENLALCAASMVAFLPMSARQAAVVNNDVLARFWVAVTLLLAARWVCRRARPLEIGAALAALGLGLLTKPTTASSAAVLILAWALRARRDRHGPAPDAPSERRGSWRVLAVALAFAAVVALAVGVWLTQHNTVLPRSLHGLATRLQRGFSLASLASIGRTLSGSFGWESRFVPDALSIALWCALLSGAALALGRLRGRAPDSGRRVGVHSGVLLLCAAGVAAQVLLVLMRGTARGRYLMPGLPALSVLFVAGACARGDERFRARAARWSVLAWIAIEAAFVFGGLLNQEWLRWGV